MDVANSATLEEGNQPTRVVALPIDIRAIQGVWLLLISLGVFFLASILLLVGYVAARMSTASGHTQPFALPASLIPSTLFLVGVSMFLESAWRFAKKDRFGAVKICVLIASACGLGFVAVQSEGLTELIIRFADAHSKSESVYGFVFILVFLHAAHVLGGIVGLWETTRKAMRNAYDHERNFGLRFCTLYWHFLDLVWVVLIGSFLTTAWLIQSRP